MADETMAIVSEEEEDQFGCPINDVLSNVHTESSDNEYCFMCCNDVEDEDDEDYRLFNLFLREKVGTKFALSKAVGMIFEYYNTFLRDKHEIEQDGNLVTAPEWTTASIFKHLTTHSTSHIDFKIGYHIETHLEIMRICKDNMLDKTGTRLDPARVTMYMNVTKNVLALMEKWKRL